MPKHATRTSWKKGDIPNPTGRPKISLTNEIKRVLLEIPEELKTAENKQTYLDLILKRILNLCIKKGDPQMIRCVWNYIDGLPKETVDMNTKIKVDHIINVEEFKKYEGIAKEFEEKLKTKIK